MSEWIAADEPTRAGQAIGLTAGAHWRARAIALARQTERADKQRQRRGVTPLSMDKHDSTLAQRASRQGDARVVAGAWSGGLAGRILALMGALDGCPRWVPSMGALDGCPRWVPVPEVTRMLEVVMRNR
jgi:hypothetical protein